MKHTKTLKIERKVLFVFEGKKPVKLNGGFTEMGDMDTTTTTTTILTTTNSGMFFSPAFKR